MSDGLTPREELELLRRREAEQQRRRNDEMNRLLRAAYAEHRGKRRPARRARLIPRFAAAYRAAIEALLHQQVKITWAAVTERLGRDHGIPGLAVSTVRRWALEDGLPHPSVLAKELAAGS